MPFFRCLLSTSVIFFLLLSTMCLVPGGLALALKDDQGVDGRVSAAHPRVDADARDANRSRPVGENPENPGGNFSTKVPPGSGLDPETATTATTLHENTTLTTQITTTLHDNTTTTAHDNSTTTTAPSNSTSTATTATSSTTNRTTTTAHQPTNSTTTVAPTPVPSGGRRFDGWSFFGGIILTLVVIAIAFVAYKYYIVRRGAQGNTNYDRF